MKRKSPGKPGRGEIGMRELGRRFPDDMAAEAWLAECRWSAGFTAPTAIPSKAHAKAEEVDLCVPLDDEIPVQQIPLEGILSTRRPQKTSHRRALAVNLETS